MMESAEVRKLKSRRTLKSKDLRSPFDTGPVSRRWSLPSHHPDLKVPDRRSTRGGPGGGASIESGRGIESTTAGGQKASTSSDAPPTAVPTRNGLTVLPTEPEEEKGADEGAEKIGTEPLKYVHVYIASKLMIPQPARISKSCCRGEPPKPRMERSQAGCTTIVIMGFVSAWSWNTSVVTM